MNKRSKKGQVRIIALLEHLSASRPSVLVPCFAWCPSVHFVTNGKTQAHTHTLSFIDKDNHSLSWSQFVSLQTSLLCLQMGPGPSASAWGPVFTKRWRTTPTSTTTGRWCRRLCASSTSKMVWWPPLGDGRSWWWRSRGTLSHSAQVKWIVLMGFIISFLVLNLMLSR